MAAGSALELDGPVISFLSFMRFMIGSSGLRRNPIRGRERSRPDIPVRQSIREHRVSRIPREFPPRPASLLAHRRPRGRPSLRMWIASFKTLHAPARMMSPMRTLIAGSTQVQPVNRRIMPAAMTPTEERASPSTCRRSGARVQVVMLMVPQDEGREVRDEADCRDDEHGTGDDGAWIANRLIASRKISSATTTSVVPLMNAAMTLIR